DIIVENFRPGRLEAWGLGYEELAAINPKIILVRVTGFGQDGPYAQRAGFGSIGEALGGLRYIVGEPDGAPSRVGISIGDALAGTMGALGALLALHVRERTGHGQVVDAAIFESVLAFMESLVPEYDLAGYVRERTGAVLPNVAPSNAYPTKDGQTVLIAANQDAVFRRLATAMSRPELANDARYATHSARGKNMVELDELIAEWSLTLPADDLLELLESNGVPAGPIYRAPEMLQDPHFSARESIITVPHPEFGNFRMQGVFPKLSHSPGGVRWVGPSLGEHNDEIFQELLQLSDDEIAAAITV
ncbi:MAG: CaiB/BaiF CoA-transferase family protein, partial [Nitriliruptoraceae bacterium]